MPIPYQGLTFGVMLVVAVGSAIYYYFTNTNTPMYHQPVQAELHLPPLPGTSAARSRTRRRGLNLENCSICLDRLSASRIRTLKCKHIFHEHCINMWFGTHRTCPLCRRDV